MLPFNQLVLPTTPKARHPKSPNKGGTPSTPGTRALVLPFSQLVLGTTPRAHHPESPLT